MRKEKTEIKTVELLTLNLDNMAETTQRIRDAYTDAAVAGRVFCEVTNLAHKRYVSPMSQISHVWYTLDGKLA